MNNTFVTVFPAATNSEDFHVRLTRTRRETPFGLSLHCLEKKFVLVKQVKSRGLVPAWNRANEKQVEAGDIILDINGISGNTDAMMKELDKWSIVLSISKGMPVDFTCELERDEDSTIGVLAGFPVAIPGVIVVKSLKEDGIIPDYNKIVPERNKINAGDLMVAVNDIRKDVDAMMKQFQEQKISISVKKGPDFDFSAHLKQHSENETIGLSIGVDGTTQLLFVTEVEDGGTVAQWNISHPDKLIQLNDAIVSVNGVAGNIHQMIAEIKELSPLLILRRCVDKDDDDEALTGDDNSKLFPR